MTLWQILDGVLHDHDERGLMRLILNEGEPYLYRVYLDGRRGEDAESECTGGIYLHKFVSSDDRVHHNHPWDVSTSIILAGMYVEHRWGALPRVFRPGDVNTIQQHDFHYIELVTSAVWTMFCPGLRVGGWGFKLPDGTYVPHEEHREG